jgi:hypothetical protein
VKWVNWVKFVPNVENWMVALGEVGNDKEVLVLVCDAFALLAALEGPAQLVADHLVIPDNLVD